MATGCESGFCGAPCVIGQVVSASRTAAARQRAHIERQPRARKPCTVSPPSHGHRLYTRPLRMAQLQRHYASPWPAFSEHCCAIYIFSGPHRAGLENRVASVKNQENHIITREENWKRSGLLFHEDTRPFFSLNVCKKTLNWHVFCRREIRRFADFPFVHWIGSIGVFGTFRGKGIARSARDPVGQS